MLTREIFELSASGLQAVMQQFNPRSSGYSTRFMEGSTGVESSYVIRRGQVESGVDGYGWIGLDNFAKSLWTCRMILLSFIYYKQDGWDNYFVQRSNYELSAKNCDVL